jgi:tetratricopeptide (TPR) repeat protein
MNDWQGVWERLKNGQHAVVQRTGPLPGPNPHELRLIEIDCEAFLGEPRGMLEEVRRRIELLLEGTAHPIVDAAASRLRAGLRRHLLGETAESADMARYLLTFERCAEAGEPRVALLLRSIDRADAASLELLTRMITGEGVPRLPMLFSFDAHEPTGPARRLLEKLRRVLPSDAFVRWRGTEELGAAAGASRLPGLLSGLTPRALNVLRAAAVIGDRFESEVVATLLGLDELAVLGALQEAVDHGVDLEDRGQGIFRLEKGLADTLRARTLPSLARAWHERLAELFGGPPAPLYASTSTSPSPVDAATPAALASAPGIAPSEAAASPPSEAQSQAAEDWFDAPPSQRPEMADARRDAWWQRLEADLMAARADAGASNVEPVAAPQSARAPETSSGAASSRGTSELRAAAHAEAAGLWHTACEQHLAAAERASLAGSHQVALEHAARARILAEQLGDREGRRRVQVLALLLTGRSRWLCQAPGAVYPLSAALEPLLSCRALMTEADPPPLRAELASIIANVQYDVGSPDALEQALQELTIAGQILLDAGRPLDAARLLNDEAAVWVKLGDPVRANHLLSRSRDVFNKVAGSYPAARVELAETEHLLARLLLTAQARPGRERAALQLGVEHGRAAEEAYRDLNEMQKLGRVWETLGRLELRLGHLDVAAKLFDDARELQRKLGDAVGLARSSAASSEVLAQAQDYARAIERLAESITLNSEKGLRAGLEFNMGSLQQLKPQLPGELQDAADGLERLLRQSLSQHAEVLAVA